MEIAEKCVLVQSRRGLRVHGMGILICLTFPCNENPVPQRWSTAGTISITVGDAPGAEPVDLALFYATPPQFLERQGLLQARFLTKSTGPARAMGGCITVQRRIIYFRRDLPRMVQLIRQSAIVVVPVSRGFAPVRLWDRIRAFGGS